MHLKQVLNDCYPLKQVLEDCYESIFQYLNLRVLTNICTDILTVTTAEYKVLGYFSVHTTEGNWFDIEEPINGKRTGSVHLSVLDPDELSSDEILYLFHEVYHAIHHILNDLETVEPRYWELGSMLGESFCSDKYGICRTPLQLKKDIAIAMVDSELAYGNLSPENVVLLVEEIQDRLGIELVKEDFNTCISGEYAGSYFTYPYCRQLVQSDRNSVIKKLRVDSTT